MSRSRAHVDLGAIADNLRAVESQAGVAVCAVVKANAYGHGAVAVADAAVVAGASMLAVAHVDEAAELRSAGAASPMLVLSEPDPHQLSSVVSLGLQQVVYRAETIDALAAAADGAGIDVHLKIDTGMRRVGCRPDDALGLARRIVDHPGLRLAGTMTHLAVADEPGNPATDAQLDAFDDVLRAFADAGIDPGIRHAANSAGAIAVPRSRYDMVRVGIALYGLAPSPALAGMVPLEPALRWTSTVAMVKAVAAGDAVSYGRRHTFDHDAIVATVPVGYADGYRRSLGLDGGAVLIGGRRCPIRGVVTMDQLVVEVDAAAVPAVGDEVVLIGAQGRESITADDLAERLGTITYEITCAISQRVERTQERPA